LSNPYASPEFPKTRRFFTSFLIDENIRPAEKLLTAAKMFITDGAHALGQLQSREGLGDFHALKERARMHQCNMALISQRVPSRD
jgi:hypothetical protein